MLQQNDLAAKDINGPSSLLYQKKVKDRMNTT